MSCTPIFFLLLLSIPFVKPNTNLIQTTCKNTKYYELCMSSLRSNPSSPNADTKGLAMIMVGIGMANATSTSSYLSSQVFSTTNDLTMKKVVNECAVKYSNAADSLQSSVQHITEENYDYATMDIMAAADYPNGCHNAFRRYPGLVYPPEISRREDGLKHICDVLLGMINLLF